MDLPPHVIAFLAVGSILAVLVSVVILRVSCYLAREDSPGWTAALGIKIGALFVGSIFSWFVYAMAASGSQHHKSKADVILALNLFTLLANILLNAGVYRVTMPWMTYAKSLLVVIIEAVIGTILGALLLLAFVAIVTSTGIYTAEQLQEMFQQ